MARAPSPYPREVVSVVSGLKDVRLQRSSILTLFSVLLPGLALVVEVSALLPPIGDGLKSIGDERLLGIVPDAGATAALGVLAVGLAYPAGLVSRQIAFKALELVKVRTAGAVMLEFKDAYGPERIDRVLAAHPMVKHYLDRHSSPTRIKGKRIRDDNRFALSYLKNWVEIFAPALSIGGLETEINILLAIPLPSALAAIVIATKEPLFEWATIVAVLAAVAVCVGSFLAAVSRRYYEIGGAIQHFVLAHEWELRPEKSVDGKGEETAS